MFNGISTFSNYGVDYMITELTVMKKVENFKNKVLQAIDASEKNGGNYLEKRNKFLQTFKENVNLIIYTQSNKHSGNENSSYVAFRDDCFLKERKNLTTYVAWIY